METALQPVDPRWDDLVDRLAVYDLDYLTGGSAWDGGASPYHSPADVPVEPLLLDLARSPEPRLRSALVALLFRHPEFAPAALAVAMRLEPGRTRLLLRAGVLAAAALRRTWRFVLGIYLPGQPALAAEDLALAMGVPSPEEDYGWSCLVAVADRLRADQPFPFAYERDWQDAVGQVLASLRAAARRRGG